MSDTKTPAGAPQKPAAGGPPAPIVADLGPRSRKAVKKLRKGEGPLLEDAENLVRQLQADAAVGPGAQPVIVIVKERRRKFGMFL